MKIFITGAAGFIGSNLVEKFALKHRCKIILEPGRFIIGNAGVLVTKITYIKKTKNKDFIILDAGMNDLIRPALYGVRHSIVPSKKNNANYKKTYSEAYKKHNLRCTTFQKKQVSKIRQGTQLLSRPWTCKGG